MYTISGAKSLSQKKKRHEKKFPCPVLHASPVHPRILLFLIFQPSGGMLKGENYNYPVSFCPEPARSLRTLKEPPSSQTDVYAQAKRKKERNLNLLVCNDILSIIYATNATSNESGSLKPKTKQDRLGASVLILIRRPRRQKKPLACG